MSSDISLNMLNNRRSDFDVTNTVQVSSPRAVLEAVTTLYRPTWPGLSLDPIERAFEHFERLFAGEVPGFHGVDTVYHDRQHTLDITLALARLLVGFERQSRPGRPVERGDGLQHRAGRAHLHGVGDVEIAAPGAKHVGTRCRLT